MINTPMNAYDEMVKDLIKSDSSLVFGNISAEHAKFIIKAFVEDAKQSIEILSGSFCDKFYTEIDFYNSIKKAAEKIKSSDKIRIITLNNNTNYKDIRDKFSAINKSLGRDVITYIPCEYSGENPIQHFMIVDDKRYREEEPHEDFGHNIPESVKASVCCNGVKKAKELVSKFDSIWNALKVKTPIHA